MKFIFAIEPAEKLATAALTWTALTIKLSALLTVVADEPSPYTRLAPDVSLTVNQSLSAGVSTSDPCIVIVPTKEAVDTLTVCNPSVYP